MFATKALRASAGAHAKRIPLIKFPDRSKTRMASPLYFVTTELTRIDSEDHARHAHPASPTHELPKDFDSPPKSTSFSSYRQQAQQHGPLGNSSRRASGVSGQALGPVAPPKGEYFDRNELPARFRRALIDLTEIDAIETGGATLVC